MSQNAFASLNLSASLIKNLESLEYKEMTPIQAQSLPFILNGKDVIAQGKTGSGKTAAFGLGLLEKLNVKNFRVQSLVLCPTRELADQVAKEIRRLGRSVHNIKVLTLCGGAPFGPQIGSLEHGAHIIVGTPGRVEEHLRKGTLSLQDLTMLVLDEADRMLEMGFQSTLDSIIEHAPEDRQTLLFSATFPDQIKRISQRITNQPEMIQAVSTHDDSSIAQHVFKVDDFSDDGVDRLTGTRLLLQHYRPESAVVFCRTKKECQEVADDLDGFGFSVLALHGDLEQRDRDQTLVRFANKSISILVATDVASRGLDIDALDLVINYNIAHDEEVHVHRIGRTGRAGSKGVACTFFNEKETYKIAQLEEYIDQKINVESFPSLSLLNELIDKPTMVTLLIDGGKKQKVRPGDILGALTGKNSGGAEGIAGKDVGKIQIFDHRAYVAIRMTVVKTALKKLTEGKLKGRSFRVRRM